MLDFKRCNFYQDAEQKGIKTYEGLENKYGEILSYLEDYCNNATRYIINKVL